MEEINNIDQVQINESSELSNHSKQQVGMRIQISTNLIPLHIIYASYSLT